MKKLLIVSWHGLGDKGGVETMTQYMVQAWNDMYDIEIVDFDSMSKKSLYKEFLGKHYTLDAILVSLYTNKKIHKYGRKNVRVVTQGYNAPLVRADIAFAHGTMRDLKISVYGDKRWHFHEIFEAYSWKRADKVVAVSEHVKEEAMGLYHVSGDKIIVLENCVNTEAFFPMERVNTDNICTLLFAGRLETRKGLNNLLEMAKIIEQRDDFRLLIGTPTSTNTELFDGMQHTEVRVGLKRNEMNIFYNSGNVLYFPSLHEGFALVTMEALSAGIPAIVTDIGGLRELYHKGVEGVELAGEEKEKDLLNARRLADRYQTYDARMRLHNAMVKEFSFNLYHDKLKELWK